MRLNNKEKQTIKSVIKSIFKTDKIYLFGSVLDDSKRGGDIDIFVITNKKNFGNVSKAKYILEDKLLRPIDIVIHKDFKRTIEQEALKGVKL